MVGIDYFKQLNVSWGQIMAYATMITVPILVLFIAFQRSFINSIASSGVKGWGVFGLPEAWVWDFWLVDDGQKYHPLLPLRLPSPPGSRPSPLSGIGRPRRIDELCQWQRVSDALVRSDAPAFDDLATWTGSVVRHPDGTWFMFYTGATLTPEGNIQRIGFATSD